MNNVLLTLQIHWNLGHSWLDFQNVSQRLESWSNLCRIDSCGGVVPLFWSATRCGMLAIGICCSALACKLNGSFRTRYCLSFLTASNLSLSLEHSMINGDGDPMSRVSPGTCYTQISHFIPLLLTTVEYYIIYSQIIWRIYSLCI